MHCIRRHVLRCVLIAPARAPRSPAILVALGVLIISGSAAATTVALQNDTADFSQSSFGGLIISKTTDGDFTGSNGWGIDPQEGAPHTGVWETQIDLGPGTFTFEIYHNWVNTGSHGLGRFRWSVTADDRSTFADGLATGGDVTANWTVLTPLNATANSAILTIQPDGSILASGPNQAPELYTITADSVLAGITGIRLEALTDASLPFNGPGRQEVNGNFVLTEIVVDHVDANVIPLPAAPWLALPLLCVKRPRRL